MYPIEEEEPTLSPMDCNQSRVPPSSPDQQETQAKTFHFTQEIQELKRKHQEEKACYVAEIEHLRQLLSEAERGNREQAEIIRRQHNRLEKSATRRQAVVEERNELIETRKQLLADVENKRRELSRAMDLLASTHRELLRVVGTRFSQQGDGEVVDYRPRSASQTPPSQVTDLEGYSSLPDQVAKLRESLVNSEERFHAAYTAWSSSSKHQRRMSNSAVNDINLQLKKSEDFGKHLLTDNQRLAAELYSLKDRVAFMSRELEGARKELRSRPAMSVGQECVTVETAIAAVKDVNQQVVDTAWRIAGALQPMALEGSRVEATSLPITHTLLGEDLVSLGLRHRVNSEDRNSPRLWGLLLQVALTNWCAYSVNAWNLHRIQDPEDPIQAVFRRLKTVEDPLVVAQWRCLTRAQLQVSSRQWYEHLASSINEVLQAIGLTWDQGGDISNNLEPLVATVRTLRHTIGELLLEPELEVYVTDQSVNSSFLEGISSGEAMAAVQLDLRVPSRR